ncbi:hypothetical protein BU17DRAFT_91802 [Hysterangium stoloniferum]|nr:hypothetical protein BU17DRAFT_91802 [Hysterangium stoloniferum]
MGRLSSDDRPTSYRPQSSWLTVRRVSRGLTWALCIIATLATIFFTWQPSAPHVPKSFAQGGKPPLAREKYRFRTPQNRKPTMKTEHNYRPDGIVEVNPDGRHPIYELIETAEAQWKRKLARQSKTLNEAVEEYKRRYGRPPPKGFDAWWHYVEFNSVKLPDEYDSIHHRIQPFWAIPPADLIAAQPLWEQRRDQFVIGKAAGSSKVSLLNQTMSEEAQRIGRLRIEQQLDILKDIGQYLPEFRATFNMHDTPIRFISWEWRKAAEDAAAKGQYVNVRNIPVTNRGWAAACPPETPIHSYPLAPLPTLGVPLNPPPLPAKKSFIHDHPISMSPCLHPSHLPLSGFLSSRHFDTQFGPHLDAELLPIFSICASPLNADILTPAPEQFVEKGKIGVDPDWSDKVDERLLWRGSNTGAWADHGKEYNISQRYRLVELGTRRGGEMTVIFPKDRDAAVGPGETVTTGAFNAAYMDISFVARPVQCNEPVCGDLQRTFEWLKFQHWDNAWAYKYILDIDGNGWSARFKRLMTSKSLIFKSTIFPEWYTERIMAWVHYVPVQVNLSDLHDIIAFFRGSNVLGSSKISGNDVLAERIANAGTKWSDTFYRKEDMTAYNFRLFLEYARVMSPDRDAASYVEEGWEEDIDVGS